MLHSPNLNIINKSLQKIQPRLVRDFVELENLQNNNFSAIKFANSAYKRVEENLITDLQKLRGDYGIKMIDGRFFGYENSQYQYIICPIDGLFNLSRSIQYFSTFIALKHISKNGMETIINSAILNPINNDIYLCEKGSGAFLNNRKIRVSKRELQDNILCSLAHIDLVNHKFIKNIKDKKAVLQVSNCVSLDIVNFAIGKIDLCVLKKSDIGFIEPILLIAKEAGGVVEENDDLIIITNGRLK